MLAAIELLSLTLAVTSLVPSSVLLVQIAFALRVSSIPLVGALRCAPDARFAVLMPAHDEAAGIAPPIRAVLAQLRARDRLLVVADNCSDDTASVARALGAEVTERFDATRRGKGFALDHGVRRLAADPPDAVIVVDADCVIGPNALERLVEASLRLGRPVQALYLMRTPASSPLSTRIAAFAWAVRNQLRPAGADAMGWPCQLMGTGMVFPWELLRAAPLASGNLVEDLQLGLDLASKGRPPKFCADVSVSSEFPSDAAGMRAQRTRWEHGHLSIMGGALPRHVWRAVRTRNGPLLAMALDLAVPPLAALVLLLGVLLASCATLWLAGGSFWPFAVAGLSMTLLTAGVLVAWAGHARHLISGGELLALPWYVIRKIPLYVQLFTRRQVEWVRTKRNG